MTNKQTPANVANIIRYENGSETRVIAKDGSNEIVISRADSMIDYDIALYNDITQVGQAANDYASFIAFNRYLASLSPNTKRRYKADLASFTVFLSEMQIDTATFGLAISPTCWQHITVGLVKLFVEWSSKAGYALTTINNRLSTIKAYSLAAKDSNAMSLETYLAIKDIKGYSHKDMLNVDASRTDAGLSTRREKTKKADSVNLNVIQVHQLVTFHPDTPQGRRNRFVLTILFEHGLRCGEVAGLEYDNFDLESASLTFYRQKVRKYQTHKLTSLTLSSVIAYFSTDKITKSPIVRTSNRSGELTVKAMGTRSITKIVKQAGIRVLGIPNLSAHDCRHYAATKYAKTKNLKELMDIFGWKSPVMALRYIDDVKVIELD